MTATGVTYLERNVHLVPAEQIAMKENTQARYFSAMICIVMIIGLTGCHRSPEAREANFLKRAKVLAEKKDYSRAILELRNASQAVPKDAEPYYILGTINIQQGDRVSAGMAFRKALALNPKDANARMKLAELMVATRQKKFLTEAEQQLKEVLAAAPDRVEAIDSLAEAEIDLGKTDDARRRLEKALEMFPADLRSAVLLARLKLAQNDLNGAEDVLKKASQDSPQSAQAASALGQFYILTNRLDLAESQLRRAVQLNASDAKALMTLAAIQLKDKHWDQAEQIFKQVSSLPDIPYRSAHAIYLFHRGRQAAAIVEFERIAREEPGDRGVRTRLVSAYLATHQVSKAEQVLGDALKQNPNDIDALFQRGQMYLNQGQTAAAEKDFQLIVHFSPSSAQAHYALANVNRLQGNRLVERQELNEALQLDPNLSTARSELARYFMLAREPESALAVIAQAPPSQPLTVELIVERNWALIALGKRDEARSGIAEGMRLGKTSDLVLQDGLVKLGQAEYDAARASAEEFLQHSPEDARGAELLANTYLAQRQLPKAIESLKRLVSARPKSAPLQELLGRWYLRGGNRMEAKMAFAAAKAADPNFWPADLHLADLDLWDNRLDAARQHLAAVLAADSKNIGALLRMAEVEKRSGNHSAAISRLQAVLDIDSSNVMALNGMAHETPQDHPDEALSYAQKALEAAPQDSGTQDTLGWIYYRKGLYPMAIEHFKTAVAKDATPRHQFHLAMAYLKVGDKLHGGTMLQMALNRDPTLPKTEIGW